MTSGEDKEKIRLEPGETMTNDDRNSVLNPASDPPPVAAEVPVFPPQPMNVTRGIAERFVAPPPNVGTRSKGSKGSGKAGGKGAAGKTISRGHSYTPTTSSKPKKRKVGKKKAFKISGVFPGGQKYGTRTKASHKTASRKPVARKRYRGK